MFRRPRRAEVSPEYPRAWGTCDFCGFITNHHKLQWQHQWSATQLINLRYLVCEDCRDRPQEQLRVFLPGPDPDPLFNARIEPFAIDEANYRVTQNGIRRITQGGQPRVVQSG